MVAYASKYRSISVEVIKLLNKHYMVLNVFCIQPRVLYIIPHKS